MADAYQFGGTNGVAKLNIGTPGSARAAANQAEYRPNVIGGRIEINRVVNELPQQGETFVDNLGFAGQMIRFAGILKVATDTVLAAIEAELSLFTTGQTITAGVRGQVVASRMKSTTLANGSGRVLADKAIMLEPEWGRQRTITSSAYFTLARELSLNFRILG